MTDAVPQYYVSDYPLLGKRQIRPSVLRFRRYNVDWEVVFFVEANLRLLLRLRCPTCYSVGQMQFACPDRLHADSYSLSDPDMEQLEELLTKAVGPYECLVELNPFRSAVIKLFRTHRDEILAVNKEAFHAK